MSELNALHVLVRFDSEWWLLWRLLLWSVLWKFYAPLVVAKLRHSKKAACNLHQFRQAIIAVAILNETVIRAVFQ